MAYSVDEAIAACDDMQTVARRLHGLHDLGLGCLTLSGETPSMSGGEAQRPKTGKGQEDTVFVFDEPTIGLHPLGEKTLIRVFQHLIGQGTTVIVIEHGLAVIRGADYVADMGPGGSHQGGRAVAAGTPDEIRQSPAGVTGRYL